MRTGRSGLGGHVRGLGTTLLVCLAATACAVVDQLAPTGGRVPDAPIVPPIPAPPDVVAPAAPIDGALWEVDGHPAAIIGVQRVAGGRVAYLSSWAGIGLLAEGGDLVSRPVFAPRGWMAAQLSAWPDGPLLAAATTAGIEVWDVATGWPLGAFGEPWAVVAVSPDGATIALSQPSDGGDGASRILLWDVMVGSLLHSIAVDGAIHALAWSSDGTRLAIASDDLSVFDLDVEDVVWHTDLDSGYGAELRWHPEAALVTHILGSTATVFDVDGRTHTVAAFTERLTTGRWSDAEHLTVVGLSGDVLAWSRVSEETKKVGSVPAFTLAFEPIDGARAAIGTRSGSVGIWNVEAGEAERLVAPAMDRGEALAMSHDGRLLVSGGNSGLVRTWRTEDGAMLGERLMGEERIDGLAWSPDGRTIAVAHSFGIDLLDASTLDLLASSDTFPGTLAFGPAGTLLVYGGFVLDPSTLEPMYPPTESWGNAAWGPEGVSIAIGTHEGEVRIHDLASGSLTTTIPTDLDRIVRIAWSPDGTVIAVADYTEIVVIDANTGERRFSIAHRGPLTTLAFSADSTFLVTSGWAGAVDDGHVGSVRLWDVVSGTTRAALGGTSTAGGVAVSHDGRYVALTNWEGKVAYVEVGASGD